MAIPTKIKSNNGMKGLAEVRVLADYIRVIFRADGDAYQVRKDGFDRESGIYNVTLNRSNDEIKFIAPPGNPNEPYLVRFKEFSNRVGRTDDNPGVAEPKIDPGGQRMGRNGPYYAEDRLVARAKLEIVAGPYKGLNIIYTVPYLFTQYNGTTLTMIEGTSGQRRILETFLTTAGMDMINDEIPWSGNVLPYIESQLQAAGKIFSVRLNEKGYVDKDGLAPIPSYALAAILGETEEKKPAKPAKSKAGAKKKTARK